MLYHLGVPGFSGGLLGVGVFFTLSGYLITSLLISARERHGGFDLKNFWLRRARRLIPAMLLVVVTTLIATAIALPDKLADTGKQALAAFFYVNNWFNIFSSESYFDRFDGPGALSHLWSLSIEEQFYIVWPLLLGLLYLILRSRALITGAIVLLALGSFYLLYALAEPLMDNTRAYEGTDTRAGGLLLGAALAFWWPARAHRVNHDQRCLLDVIGLAGLAGVGHLVATTPDGGLILYEYVIAALTVATLAILMAAVTPDSLVATLLGTQPLRWIGERSYGIYLWHMPLVAFIPPALRADSPIVTATVVIVFTVLLSALSWRYLEDPIRRHGFIAAFTRPRPLPDPVESPMLTRFIAALISLLTGMLTRLRRTHDRLTATAPTGSSSSGPDGEPAETDADPGGADADPTGAAQQSESETVEAPPPLIEEPVELRDPTDRLEQPVEVLQRHQTTAALTDLVEIVVIPPPVEADEHTETGRVDDSPEHGRPTETTGPTESTPPATPTGTAAAAPEVRDRPHRGRLQPILGLLVVAMLAAGVLVGIGALRPDLPVINAFVTSDESPELAEEIDEAATVTAGPTLPPAQRRTSCTRVIHVGDSTSIAMNSPDYLPRADQRIVGRYQQVGATRVDTDIVGGRSSLEELPGEPNARKSIEASVAAGTHGCWVMAMGVNDTANVEVGGPGPIDMRIDRLMEPLGDQPVLWPTVITNRLNQNPAYDNRAMQEFNQALLEACKRYPNLRIYDWAGETEQEWFDDGVHYTTEGNIERARRFAVALASTFPAEDAPPAGCLLRSTE